MVKMPRPTSIRHKAVTNIALRLYFLEIGAKTAEAITPMMTLMVDIMEKACA